MINFVIRVFLLSMKWMNVKNAFNLWNLPHIVFFSFFNIDYASKTIVVKKNKQNLKFSMSSMSLQYIWKLSLLNSWLSWPQCCKHAVFKAFLIFLPVDKSAVLYTMLRVGDRKRQTPDHLCTEDWADTSSFFVYNITKDKVRNLIIM